MKKLLFKRFLFDSADLAASVGNNSMEFNLYGIPNKYSAVFHVFIKHRSFYIFLPVILCILILNIVPNKRDLGTRKFQSAKGKAPHGRNRL